MNYKCVNCGALFQDQRPFCSQCGVKLNWNAKAASSQAGNKTPPPQPPPSAQQKPMPSYNCGDCGASVYYRQTPCIQCGKAIDWSKTLATISSENLPYSQTASPMPTSKPISASQPIITGEQTGITNNQEQDAKRTAPVLQTWKTSVGFSILGVVCSALYFVLFSTINGYLNQWSGLIPLLIQLAFVVFFVIVLPIRYATIAYPSYFGSTPDNTSSKAISFWNCFFGSMFFVFGPLWNHSLTKGKKGKSNIVFTSLFFIMPILVYAALAIATLTLPSNGSVQNASPERTSSLGQNDASSWQAVEIPRIGTIKIPPTMEEPSQGFLDYMNIIETDYSHVIAHERGFNDASAEEKNAVWYGAMLTFTIYEGREGGYGTLTFDGDTVTDADIGALNDNMSISTEEYYIGELSALSITEFETTIETVNEMTCIHTGFVVDYGNGRIERVDEYYFQNVNYAISLFSYCHIDEYGTWKDLFEYSLSTFRIS